MRERHSPVDRDPDCRLGLSGAGARIEASAQAVMAKALPLAWRIGCLFAAIVTMVVALNPARQALAHASLLSSVPEEGVTLSQPPKTFRLEFNEPVSPLVMRLVRPTGQVATLTDAS